MGENTKIEWAHHTFNAFIGCTKVSPACAHCYAETLVSMRFRRAEWGPGKPRVRTSAENWKLPLRWNREAAALGKPARVFCASLSDWLDDDGVPIEWLADLLALIHDTPALVWMLLTKRPQNFAARMGAAFHILRTGDRHDVARWLDSWIHLSNPPQNVWVGATVEDQCRAKVRVPQLLAIPARVRFLSCEPLLGFVDLTRAWGECSGCTDPRSEGTHQSNTRQHPSFPEGLNWVIAGGESGIGARPSHPAWFRALRDQCAAAGAAFFFKQWGSWCPEKPDADEWEQDGIFLDGSDLPNNWRTREDFACITAEGRRVDGYRGGSEVFLHRTRKGAAGRSLDGREWNEFPEIAAR